MNTKLNDIEIRIIEAANKEDINIANEPFSLFGKMLVKFDGSKWNYEEIIFPNNKQSEMTFPDENNSYETKKNNSVFIGAYCKNKCVGLAIMQHFFLKNYMYLYDLKVNKEYRRQNVGIMLINKAKEVALKSGYNGIYTQAQDNNLAACKFYLKCGFKIGGLNTNVYKYTKQECKSDIFFYLDC